MCNFGFLAATTFHRLPYFHKERRVELHERSGPGQRRQAVESGAESRARPRELLLISLPARTFYGEHGDHYLVRNRTEVEVQHEAHQIVVRRMVLELHRNVQHRRTGGQ